MRDKFKVFVFRSGHDRVLRGWRGLAWALVLMFLFNCGANADQTKLDIQGPWHGYLAKSGSAVWLIRLELDPLQPKPEKRSPLERTFVQEMTPPDVSVLYHYKQLPLQLMTGTLQYLSTHHKLPKDTEGQDPREARWVEDMGEIKAIGYYQPQTGRFVLNLANHTRRAGNPQISDRAIYGFYSPTDQKIIARPHTQSFGAMILQRPDALDMKTLAFFDPKGEYEVADSERVESQPEVESKPEPEPRRGTREEAQTPANEFEERDQWVKQQRDKLGERYETIHQRIKDDGTLTQADTQPIALPDWARELLAAHDRPIRDRTADYKKRYPDRELSDSKLLFNWRALEQDKLRAIASVNRDHQRDAKRAAQAKEREQRNQEFAKENVSIVGKIADDDKKIADPEAMTAWLAQLQSIHPDLDPESEKYLRDAGISLYLLLGDDYFKPHFKKSYNELTRGEAEAIRRMLRGYNRDVEFEPVGLGDGYPLYNAFEADQPRYYRAVLQYLDLLNRYAQQSVTSLDQLDPQDDSSFAAILALDGLAHRQFDSLSPKQRESFDNAFAKTSAKLTDGVALEKAKQTIADHQQNPDRRIFLIDSFWSSQELMDRYISDAGRTAADQVFDRYRVQLVKQAITKFQPRLDRLGRGIDAVNAGGGFISSFAVTSASR